MNDSAATSRSSVVMPGRRIFLMSARVPATISPAWAMPSISLGDLSVIMLPSQRLPAPVGDLLHRSDRRHPLHPVARLVPSEDRGRLLPVRPKPGGDDGRVVVGPLLLHPPAPEARPDLLGGDNREHHPLHRSPPLRQEPHRP